MMHRAHINILEFIAILTGIWLEIIENAAKPEDCILAFGDNTSAINWIYKSKFRANNEPESIFQAKLTVARKIAYLSIESELRIYNKWLPGESNQVADHLFRNPSSSDVELTQSLIEKFPSQAPKNLDVSALPQEIEYFISRLLQSLPRQEHPLPDTESLEMPHGQSGLPSLHPSESELTPSWNPYLAEDTRIRSSPYLPKTFAWDQILEKSKELRNFRIGGGNNMKYHQRIGTDLPGERPSRPKISR
jgi:hypothetical protein